MDLLQGVKDAVDEKAEVPNEISSILEDGGDATANLDKILKLMKKLNLTDENEEQLRETLMKKAEMGMLGGFKPDAFQNLNKISQEDNPGYNILLLFIFVSLIVLVFVFFGYKLYKSHTDRERKREEKRRLKQQKKKK